MAVARAVAVAVAVVVALASVDAASPGVASWEASPVPRGGWFPPPSVAAGMGGGGIAQLAVAMALVVAWR